MHVSNNSCHGGLLCPHSIWYLYHIIHYHYHPPYPWPLQGNAAAPCIWMFLSNVLLHALSSLTDGFYACCPCGLLISQRPREAFVDDTDLRRSSDILTGSELVASTAEVAQQWDRLLCASGGALALQKCFFYLMDWTWDCHGCHSLQPNSASPHLTINMTSGRSSCLSFPIPLIECHTGKCSHGVRAAPDGSFNQEFHFCLTQAKRWVSNISLAPHTRTEGYTAFNAMWSPAISYPLSVTSFTQLQCTQIQTAYVSAFLSEMGIAQTTARTIIFGSSFHSGFQIPELWVMQGTHHLPYLLGHLCATDDVGLLLRITIDTLQLHLGFPQPPLTYVCK